MRFLQGWLPIVGDIPDTCRPSFAEEHPPALGAVPWRVAPSIATIALVCLLIACVSLSTLAVGLQSIGAIAHAARVPMVEARALEMACRHPPDPACRRSRHINQAAQRCDIWTHIAHRFCARLHFLHRLYGRSYQGGLPPPVYRLASTYESWGYSWSTRTRSMQICPVIGAPVST